VNDRRQSLTDSRAREWDPTWSSDGKRIAFESDRDAGHEIFVMYVDGTNVVKPNQQGM
jgi:Tol biopolymer transport system component